MIRTLTVCVNTGNAAASTTDLLQKERGWGSETGRRRRRRRRWRWTDLSSPTDSLAVAARTSERASERSPLSVCSVCANRSRRSRPDCRRLVGMRLLTNEQQLHGKVSCSPRRGTVIFLPLHYDKRLDLGVLCPAPHRTYLPRSNGGFARESVRGIPREEAVMMKMKLQQETEERCETMCDHFFSWLTLKSIKGTFTRGLLLSVFCVVQISHWNN